VAERLVSEGDYVSAGTVILEIPRADRLQVRIPLPEAAAERLALGMLVRLKTVGAETPVEAQITHIHPHVASSNRTITVVAEIDNPGGWRPGSSVTAEVVMDARDAIVVAPTSVVRRLTGNVIYVVDDGVARERAVTVGRRTRDQVEITSGITAGDRVIVDGAGFLSEGSRIDARPHDRQPIDPTDPSLTALGEPVL
jgi:membrane fusion protein, multidrug efflux system